MSRDLSGNNFESKDPSNREITESRKSRLVRNEAELKDLYRKVDRKLDQIKSLKERKGNE